MDPRIERLVEWVGIESISGNEAGFLQVLEDELAARGYECERQKVEPQRWNLVARPPSGLTRLTYSTHVDTVPPFLEPRVEDNKVYGRGACDTKGGILAMIEAGSRLRADGLEDVGFLFVVGEEVDHCGAKLSRELDGFETERIILCEPTQNRVIEAQKGMVKLELRASGIAGHSAYPDRGVSAVHKLLGVLEAIRAEHWPQHEVLGPTTINVGVIEGGVAANVFAPSARAEVLIRAVSEVAPTLERIRQFCDVGDVEVSFPAYNDPVFFDPPEGVETSIASFNTDATYLVDIAPVWLVGPGDIQVAHSDHEHIPIPEFFAGIDLYERLGRMALS